MASAPDPQRIVATTAELVALPSHGGRELATQELLASRFAELGFETSLQFVAPTRPNLLARRGSGGVFLCTHADTQAPFHHPDPYVCRHDGERLVGRGVVDTKGQIAALLEAARVAHGPATVVITCDEEFGGAGSAWLELPDDWRPSAGQGGIVLEPTAFAVCPAQAGNVEVRLEAIGAPVHMAEPERGLSALSVLDEAIDALRSCSFLSASHPLFPPPWLHVARVHAGEHLWRTPGRGVAELSLSVLPGVDAGRAGREVAACLDALAASIAGRGAELRFEVPDVNAPIEVDAGLPVVARLNAAAGEALPVAGMRSWTDAAYLLQHHDLPCVVFGAGDLYPAHSDLEWVRLDDLVRLAGILAALL